MKKLEELKSLLDSIEEIRDRQYLKTYPNEETALLHLGRVASLQPGQRVGFYNAEGELMHGVFVRFDEHLRPQFMCFDPEDRTVMAESVVPSNIVFDDESPAEHEPEDDEDIADEFPRT